MPIARLLRIINFSANFAWPGATRPIMLLVAERIMNISMSWKASGEKQTNSV